MAKCYCSKCNMQVNRLSNYQCPNCMTLIFKDDTEYQKYNNRMAHKKNANIKNESTVDKNIQEKVHTSERKEDTPVVEPSPLTDQTVDIKDEYINEGVINTAKKEAAVSAKIEGPVQKKDSKPEIKKNNDAIKTKISMDIDGAGNALQNAKKVKKEKKKNEEKKIYIEGYNPNKDGYYNDTPYVYAEPKDNYFKETLKKFSIGAVIFIIIIIIYVWYWIN